MSEPLVKTVVIDDLWRGASPTAPARSIRPEGGRYAFRETINLLPVDGSFRRRGAIQETPSANYPLPPYAHLPSTTDDQEIPVHISVTRYVDGVTKKHGYFYLVVTTRQILIYPSEYGSWVNLTPTYITGTVTVTNGSKVVTGSGSLWSDRVVGGDILLPDGEWYTIDVVDTNTQITLASNYAGSSSAGNGYTIRRCFTKPSQTFSDESNRIFVAFGNGAIYIAAYGGQWSPALAPTLAGNPVPAVIEIDMTTIPAPTPSYIFGRAAFVSGLDVDNDLNSIHGIQSLQDGRVVIAGPSNRILYSSNLNTSVWTASPGGFVYLDPIPGQINAVGKVGNILTVHHDHGVVLGYPTGQADPPLTWQAAPRATIGAHAPRSLRHSGGVEYFLGIDGNVYRFDLSVTETIGDDVEIILRDYGPASFQYASGAVVTRSNEYILIYPTGNDSILWHYAIDIGGWYRCATGSYIGCVSDGIGEAADFPFQAASSNTENSLLTLLGARSYSSALGQERDSIVLEYRLLGQTDADYEAYNGSVSMVTDDLDFGNPLTIKQLERVVLFARSRFAGDAVIRLSVSIDGGATWTAASDRTVTFGSSKPNEILWTQFSTLNLVSGSSHLRFKLDADASTNNVRPEFLLIAAYAQEGSDVTLI